MAKEIGHIEGIGDNKATSSLQPELTRACVLSFWSFRWECGSFWWRDSMSYAATCCHIPTRSTGSSGGRVKSGGYEQGSSIASRPGQRLDEGGWNASVYLRTLRLHVRLDPMGPYGTLCDPSDPAQNEPFLVCLACFNQRLAALIKSAPKRSISLTGHTSQFLVPRNDKIRERLERKANKHSMVLHIWEMESKTERAISPYA